LRAAHAEIDLSAVRHNLALTRSFAPGSRVLAIIKADGYGHGLEAMATALSDAPNPADAFGVASIDDALRLRLSGNTRRIVLLT
jgi:alanine racemase